MPIEFIKFHGYGNDYIVIDAAQFNGVADLGEFARRICTRHYGAGADGIAVVSPWKSDEADYLVRIFNPDGSEAGLSGNGTRCAAAWLYYQRLWTAEELRLNTRSGVKRYSLKAQTGPGQYLFASELGQPKLDSASVPLVTEEPLEQVIDYPLPVNGETFAITALQMGNPNCCIFVDDFAALDWRAVGRAIETHPQFPDRTNVTFVRVLNRAQIELRIWERGVGETTASGTCSCAAAVASMINGKTERRVTALTPGGQVEIHWREDNEVVITGSAEIVYRGEWLGLE
jgi:diaminopimelate epimerase